MDSVFSTIWLKYAEPRASTTLAGQSNPLQERAAMRPQTSLAVTGVVAILWFAAGARGTNINSFLSVDFQPSTTTGATETGFQAYGDGNLTQTFSTVNGNVTVTNTEGQF